MANELSALGGAIASALDNAIGTGWRLEVDASEETGGVLARALDFALGPSWRGNDFASIEEFKAEIGSGFTRENGYVVFAGDLAFQAQSGATAITGLPGWVPVAPVSPEHFGDVGDGSTDDTDVVQAAIDYCVSSKQPLELGPKTYNVGNLTASGPLHIQGQGIEESILQHSASGTMLTFTENASYSSFSAFKALGLGDANDPDIGFQFAEDAGVNRGITYNDVWIENFRGWGIRLPDQIAFRYNGGRLRTCGDRNRSTLSPVGGGVDFYSSGTFASASTACILTYFDKVSVSGCAYGIHCDDTEVMFYSFVNECDFQSNGVGIRSIRSRNFVSLNSYFEYNDNGGANLGDGFDSFCRQNDDPGDARINAITYADGFMKQGEEGFRVFAERDDGTVFFNADIAEERITTLLANSGAVKFFPPGVSIANPAPGLYCDTGNPNGKIAALRGSLYVDYGANQRGNILFTKVSGSSLADTTWTEIVTRERGSTAGRITDLGSESVGLMYFDTTLGQPIWWDGSGWVDASGTSV